MRQKTVFIGSGIWDIKLAERSPSGQEVKSIRPETSYRAAVRESKSLWSHQN